jgi:YfiH family protein
VFALDSHGVLRAGALSAIPGLIHGFGTRNADSWPDLPTATLRQVHSDRAIFAGTPGVQDEADALVTNQSGFALAIRTADCVPILIADPAHHAIAAVHAGWRGTVAGILAKTLADMSERFDTASEDVLVAIGPAIGLSCFEVGPEVSVQFGQPAEKTHIDLVDVNRQQAMRAGVPGSRISVLGRCTRCEATQFHSYRRDKEHSGRMVAAIGWAR